MQLYAFNKERQFIFVKQAHRHTDYFCPECHGKVHLRGGFHRQYHFYHLEITPSCRQSGKSAEHLHAQLYISNQLPDNEALLERKFPTINRIADVAWEAEKLIFEIQCSPISADEILARNKDYQSIGYEVVWILHDKRFNQKLVSGAEHLLQALPHYFTNIDDAGVGSIYDQFSWIDKGIRSHRMPPLPIAIGFPKRSAFPQASTLKIVQRRMKQSQLYFSQDLIDIYFNAYLHFYEYIDAAREIEKTLTPQAQVLSNSLLAYMKRFFNHFIARPYALFFQMLLERACK